MLVIVRSCQVTSKLPGYLRVPSFFDRITGLAWLDGDEIRTEQEEITEVTELE